MRAHLWQVGDGSREVGVWGGGINSQWEGGRRGRGALPQSCCRKDMLCRQKRPPYKCTHEIFVI